MKYAPCVPSSHIHTFNVHSVVLWWHMHTPERCYGRGYIFSLPHSTTPLKTVKIGQSVSDEKRGRAGWGRSNTACRKLIKPSAIKITTTKKARIPWRHHITQTAVNLGKRRGESSLLPIKFRHIEIAMVTSRLLWVLTVPRPFLSNVADAIH